MNDKNAIDSMIPGSRFVNLEDGYWSARTGINLTSPTVFPGYEVLGLGFENPYNRGMISVVMTSRQSRASTLERLHFRDSTPKPTLDRLSESLVIHTADEQILGYSRMNGGILNDHVKKILGNGMLYKREFSASLDSAKALVSDPNFHVFAEAIHYLVNFDQDEEIVALARNSHNESNPFWDDVFFKLPHFITQSKSDRRPMLNDITGKLAINGLLQNSLLCTANEKYIRKIFTQDEIDFIRSILRAEKMELSFTNKQTEKFETSPG